MLNERQLAILTIIQEKNQITVNDLFDLVKKDMAKGTFLKALKELKGDAIKIAKHKNRKLISFSKDLDNKMQTFKLQVKGIKEEFEGVKKKIEELKDKEVQMNFLIQRMIEIEILFLIRLGINFHSTEKYSKIKQEWIDFNYIKAYQELIDSIQSEIKKKFGKEGIALYSSLYKQKVLSIR